MRCAKVEELINLLEYDAINKGNTEKTIDTLKIRDLVKDLISIFGKTSKSEIDVYFFFYFFKNFHFHFFFIFFKNFGTCQNFIFFYFFLKITFFFFF